ncbi:hypothetical protein TRAPUB_2126 [Trametes pubescens]|uniref:Uncharacterized protein n=1 Tax=Trametes pubescens TaxID=154538 RepID=A0A1M2VHM7_TRAPU|nr:hypothetical protein TRAPUB_2126 [Trametes pubescens]
MARNGRIRRCPTYVRRAGPPRSTDAWARSPHCEIRGWGDQDNAVAGATAQATLRKLYPPIGQQAANRDDAQAPRAHQSSRCASHACEGSARRDLRHKNTISSPSNVCRILDCPTETHLQNPVAIEDNLRGSDIECITRPARPLRSSWSVHSSCMRDGQHGTWFE